jgi:opacity protein-like surface antigen
MGQHTDYTLTRASGFVTTCEVTVCNFNNGSLLSSNIGHPLHGGFAGGEAGFNWQALGSRWVFGIEADGSWAEIEEALTCPIPSPGFQPSFFCGSKIGDFETVRARIGYAFGRTGSFLTYVTGGAAFASQSYSSGTLVPPFTTIDQWKRTVGWTVGGGAEYGITPWLSVKGEILYVNLNGKDYVAEAVGTGGTCFVYACVFEPAHIKHDFVLARMGLNYRFWWGKGAAPVAASY